MSALLYPEQAVRRRKNFLNEHVASLHKAQAENLRKKEEACI